MGEGGTNVEKVAEGLVRSLCACESIGKRTRHVSIVGKDGMYRTRQLHAVECPLNGEGEQHAAKLVIPIAENVVELQERVKRLEAKLVDGRAEPTMVPFDDHFLDPVELYYFHDRETTESVETFMTTLAEGLGAKVERYHWNEDSIPGIVERTEWVSERWRGSKERRKVEYIAQLRTRADGVAYYRAVFPTRQRALAYVNLCRTLKDILAGVHNAGKLYGSDLLHRLARQDITPSEFLERIEGKEEKA